ncbi:MAG: SEC-C domain-containing protein [Phycisphaerae bacterium]|nr:SEC-C domain-containing protein [Phycisphaerae bacterium]
MGAQEYLGNLFARIFGSRNDRLVKKYSHFADRVEALEPEFLNLTDEQLKAKTAEFKQRIKDGEPPEDIIPEAFATIREASRRAQNHRHFHCQLVGGKVLYDGAVAEMRTGEGKTIVCHLAAFMKIAEGNKVHIVTVNDYLVERDAEFARPVFEMLDITVGYIQAQVDPGGAEGIRKVNYACDITYGTNSEFGFDYLRDNMKLRHEDQVQGSLGYVIVDEVDSILIDEARTPLIISGPAHDDVTRYKWADNIACLLVRKQNSLNSNTRARIDAWGDNPPEQLAQNPKFQDAFKRFRVDPYLNTEEEAEAIGHQQLFNVQLERKAAHLTHDGVALAQDEAGIGSFYMGQNMDRPHLIEQSLRAHVVYERDKEYVVQDREIIIVDEFTGRLMHGRQWSDGLHQAIEAKEGVPVKEETQTLATITIQNYFKLYKSMAGMTGTALTEATEFDKIYKLEVVEIPTNRPVNRNEHNDKVCRDTKQKYEYLVEEIHEMHRRGRPADPFVLANVLSALRPISGRMGRDASQIDEALRQFNAAEYGDTKVINFLMDTYDQEMGDLATGRPVLVGTTSVENSEKLSRLLEKSYGIEHEVLNAKNHAREAEIVAKAGYRTIPTHGANPIPLGNVTIATNMAGRGTDIKLEDGVVYPKCKVPQSGDRVDGQEAGGKRQEATGNSGDGDGDSHADHNSTSTALYPPGVTKCCITCEEYDPATNCAHCYKPKLDPRFPELGRKVCTLNAPCGLHIIGTERHEARRIDNQLRGRSGRQGDPGSSRFFLSLQDDLLKLFMPDWMLKMMEKLGFSEGASLEDKRLSKGIERAQRKVEERNYSTRKHLLEWDEPMDFQRKGFYTSRQQILEGRGLRQLIFETIDDAIDDATRQFMASGYPATCIARWCNNNLDLAIPESMLTDDDLESVQESIRKRARDDAREMIITSLGEYIDEEAPPSEWDVGGLLMWGQRAYGFNATQNQLRKMEREEIEEALIEAAERHYDQVALDGVAVYLDPSHPKSALTEWARNKFNLDIKTEDVQDLSSDEISDLLKKQVREAYLQREIRYPVEVCVDRAFQEAQSDSAFVAESIVHWVNVKFNLGWTLENVQGKSAGEVFDALVGLNEEFLTGGRLAAEFDEAFAGKSDEEMIAWAKQRVGRVWDQRPFDQFDGEVREALLEQGREMLRWELSRLEHYVLLRIYDQAWKDHLLEMDHLKHAIMQRPMGGDQSHPQSQYAIEGRELFSAMWSRINERVTDMIFKVKMTGESSAQAATPRAMQLSHRDATGAAFSTARDTQAAMRAQGVEQKVETIRREKPKVGRNTPCPCGSGKKYKNCCGRQ